MYPRKSKIEQFYDNRTDRFTELYYNPSIHVLITEKARPVLVGTIIIGVRFSEDMKPEIYIKRFEDESNV